jgi:serine/threonine protein kinase
MSASAPLPRLFGPYLLTRELGRDPLGEVYRAGTTAGKSLKPFLLIRTFGGESIDSGALLPAMETAVEYLDEVKGQAVAKGAVLGIVDETPFAGIDYMPGRTLDSLLAGGEQGPVALPVEHALLIAEKLLISLEAARAFAKSTGAPHGFLSPSFIAVSNDGDIRVFGGGLGPGLLPSLKHPRARTVFGPYIAPEVAASGKPSPAGDIYSTAAILLETLTGKQPPATGAVDQLANAVLALNGNPVPEDIKALLARGLAADPAKRQGDVVAYKKELGKLLYGGPYAPSTFNLAFFMHQQFEKSIEKERKELAHEEQIDPKPILAAEEEAARAAARPAPAPKAPPADVTLPKFGLREGTAAGVDRTLGGTPIGG